MMSQNIKIGFQKRHKTISEKFFGCKTEFLSIEGLSNLFYFCASAAIQHIFSCLSVDKY